MMAEHWYVVKAFLKHLYISFLIVFLFLLATALLIGLWFILAKYFDYLLGVFPESFFLTLATFCGSIFTLIAGVSTYVSNR
jgi:hypothetical protein